MNEEISLKVDQVEIPLNAFAATIITNVVKGLLQSLNGIPEQHNLIEIVLRKTE